MRPSFSVACRSLPQYFQMKDKFLSKELEARAYRNTARISMAEMVYRDNQDPRYTIELQKLEGALDNLYRLACK